MFIGKLNNLKGADVLPEVLEQSGVKLPLLVAGAGEHAKKLAQNPQIEVLGWISQRGNAGLSGRCPGAGVSLPLGRTSRLELCWKRRHLASLQLL